MLIHHTENYYIGELLIIMMITFGRMRWLPLLQPKLSHKSWWERFKSNKMLFEIPNIFCSQFKIDKLPQWQSCAEGILRSMGGISSRGTSPSMSTDLGSTKRAMVGLIYFFVFYLYLYFHLSLYLYVNGFGVEKEGHGVSNSFLYLYFIVFVFSFVFVFVCQRIWGWQKRPWCV